MRSKKHLRKLATQLLSACVARILSFDPRTVLMSIKHSNKGISQMTDENPICDTWLLSNHHGCLSYVPAIPVARGHHWIPCASIALPCPGALKARVRHPIHQVATSCDEGSRDGCRRAWHGLYDWGTNSCTG